MEPRDSATPPRGGPFVAVATAAVVSAGVALAVATAVTSRMSNVSGPGAPPGAPVPPRAGSAHAVPAAPPAGAPAAAAPDAAAGEPAPSGALPPRTWRLGLTGESPSAKVSLVVEEGVHAVRIRVTTTGPAVVCSALDGDDPESVLHDSDDPGRTHAFTLTEHATDGFPAATVGVEVAADDDPGEGIAVDVTATPIQVAASATIAAGEEIRGRVSPANGHRFTFAVRVPKGAEVLRLDLTDCERDLDLFAETGGPTVATSEMEWGSSRPLAEDSLVCEFEEALETAAVVHVTVVDPSHDESPVPFTVLTSTKSGVPARLLEIPALPRPDDPRDRAFLATVEIVTEDGGGSGVLVSPRGHVLTACHVVERYLDGGASGREAGDPGAISVAVCLDPRKLAKDLFAAEVLLHDEDRDLALLRIVSGVRFQPLPPGYAFPAATIALRSPLLGDTVQSIGYPGIGGSGTRSPVTLSRGALSGFDRAKSGMIAKTDALVSAGSSGGGMFDSSWAFCGIAVSSGNDGDCNTLGWFVPVEEIPAAWRDQISR